MVRWKPWASAAPRPSMRSRRDPQRKDPPKDSRDHHNNSSSSNTPVETVLYSTPLDEPPAQPKMPGVVHAEKLDTGSASVRTTKRQQVATGQRPPQQNGGPRPRQNRIHDVGTDADTHCDEVRVCNSPERSRDWDCISPERSRGRCYPSQPSLLVREDHHHR